MKRYLDDHVATDLERNMVLLTGPRQVGKSRCAATSCSAYGCSELVGGLGGMTHPKHC